MKKFTLSALAIALAVTSMAATPIKTLRTPTTTQRSFEASEIPTWTQSTKLDKSLKSAIKNDLIFKANAFSVANEASNEATDETTTAATPLYMYPTGTFFPIIHYNQVVEGELKTYYETMGKALIPANKVTPFQNVSYISNNEGLFLAGEEGQSYTWTYYFGLYGASESGSFYDTTTDYSLETPLFPHAAQNSSKTRMPVLQSGDNAYIPTFASGAYQYYMSLAIGGNGAWNKGMENYYSQEVGLSNFQYDVRLSNYNVNDWGYINEVVTDGNSKSNAIFGESSPTDIRNSHISSGLEAEGLSVDDFYGMGQYFFTADNVAVLSSIKLIAYVECEAGQEVNLQLFRVSEESGSLELMYDGIHTFEEATKGAPTISFDIFDEETENEYIVLPANSSFILLLSGTSDFGVFMPTMTQCPLVNGSLSPEQVDRTLFGPSYFLAYIDNDGGLYPYEVDSNWRLSNGDVVFYTNLDYELGISYPFITPQFVYASSNTANFANFGDTEADAVYYKVAISETQSLTMAQVVFLSDASAEELKASATFSPESLKDNIVFELYNGNDIPGTSYNETSAVRHLQIAPIAEMSGGTITLDNFGEKFVINVPAYETSAIGSVVADGEAVATELYDLQGRKLSGDAQGIVVKKMTMADGSVKTVKVVK